ncbi:hypothetical protein QJS10_CPB12g01636 [Acorus calamus]|uniref:Uncharacterized protein n=1 Tax=Acorus calamus TaxID=4465 RepID=A0AAV9DND2_ACOCL|nr:hypothetical protein QJS10_CPB12g01636 [Acorus calamus]
MKERLLSSPPRPKSKPSIVRQDEREFFLLQGPVPEWGGIVVSGRSDLGHRGDENGRERNSEGGRLLEREGRSPGG